MSEWISRERLVEILAEKLEADPEELVLIWDVAEDREFLGVIVVSK